MEYENFRSEGGVNEGGGLGFLVWDSGEGALRERRSGGVALGEKVFGGGGGKCKVSVRGGLWCFGGRFWVKKAGRIGQKRAESGRIGQKRAETVPGISRHRWGTDGQRYRVAAVRYSVFKERGGGILPPRRVGGRRPGYRGVLYHKGRGMSSKKWLDLFDARFSGGATLLRHRVSQRMVSACTVRLEVMGRECRRWAGTPHPTRLMCPCARKLLARGAVTELRFCALCSCEA